MAEEHGYQSPEGHRLCANNCGFFGSPATQNYCSKCYRDICLKAAQSKPKAPVDSVFAAPPASASSPENLKGRAAAADKVEEAAAAVVLPQQATNRCSACRKKVGLTGFRCRCGVTFCGVHRYPENHGCSFDFKALGREAIAKANPLIKAEKLEKI
ncbi:PREDICTED: zinc finger A20 and AN1 domain-containing stress-associated protein 6-like [Ipomoea nil]|uniref:zinc finger A20 and AN1 domain-containing stress-associated protein 6-like n=1 Tax=Ipomoea nil TaxID=35883 RepID=UPI0009019D32|nr:PREDICTED: zinc finger A20 and AN1 domain-containing stress-associated protein 6-like [Ipomoea nil]